MHILVKVHDHVVAMITVDPRRVEFFHTRLVGDLKSNGFNRQILAESVYVGPLTHHEV